MVSGMGRPERNSDRRARRPPRLLHAVACAGLCCIWCWPSVWRSVESYWVGRVLAAEPPLAETPPQAVTSVPEVRIQKLNHPDLENLHQIHSGLYCGGSPHNEAGWQKLRQLGIQTIISVDGARPDVEAAEAAGLRYVHVPLNYRDVPLEQLRLLAAAQRLPGPIYLHCHHGKHRGPAAALAVSQALGANLPGERVREILKSLGTGAQYQGLYAAAAQAPMLDPQQIPPTDRLVAVAEVPDFITRMVAIDTAWDELLKLSRQNWKRDDGTALIASDPLWNDLIEESREAARLLDADPFAAPELQSWMHRLVGDLEALRKAASDAPAGPPAAAADMLKAIEKSCANCHAKYRT